jgi:hypothetical protein
MKRLPRALTAAVTVIALLFTQLALAALPCAGSMLETGNAQPMPGCDQVDSQSMPLCHHHCGQAAQSLDKPAAPLVAPAPLVGLVALSVSTPSMSRSQGPAFLGLPSRATHPPAPPPNTCLRI